MTGTEGYFRDHEARWHAGLQSPTQRARRRWLSPLRKWWGQMGAAFLHQHDNDITETIGEVVVRIEALEDVLKGRPDEWEGE